MHQPESFEDLLKQLVVSLSSTFGILFWRTWNLSPRTLIRSGCVHEGKETSKNSTEHASTLTKSTSNLSSTLAARWRPSTLMPALCQTHNKMHRLMRYNVTSYWLALRVRQQEMWDLQSGGTSALLLCESPNVAWINVFAQSKKLTGQCISEWCANDKFHEIIKKGYVRVMQIHGDLWHYVPWALSMAERRFGGGLNKAYLLWAWWPYTLAAFGLHPWVWGLSSLS